MGSLIGQNDSLLWGINYMRNELIHSDIIEFFFLGYHS